MKKQVQKLVLMSLLTACSLGMAGVAQADRVVDVAQLPAVPADLKGLQKALQRQQDVQQIQNLMSRRSFYHGALQQAKELELYSSRPDISFGQNQGFRVGMEQIRAAYKDRFTKVVELDRARVAKLFPKEVKDTPEYFGVGQFQFHTLTTAIIEVAEDGKTAKGMWYTPGAISGVKDDGGLNAQWIYEKYAIDFIKEGGKWKFWHILVVTDFVNPWGQRSDYAAISDVTQQGVQGVSSQAVVVPPIPKTVDRDVYKSLSSTTVPRLFPPLPEPYKTFATTFSYGPDVPNK